ncbi:sigma-54-dependent Fis family transcriptional regulator [Aliidiomarina minuta]|uniref:Sigma-54-dependent Fis family transcriptional regulator n=1 Tax=Aliidiomarina minuta TaxID=880057 RepID=A0A432W922_9GAMM|nr:sigma-54 dependent transcriptional regulator [Aliidiomarina minuta]RUO26589.1 sigma-54-dependent Fis family transcriptional regulator [Aliidiomarina minuta]
MPRVLVVDDNQDILTACRLCLKPHVADVLTLANPTELMGVLKVNKVDLVLLDMNFTRDASSGEEGIFYLKQIIAAYPQLPVVMMTAYADVNLAVRAMHLGARDFIAKPWDNQQLIDAVAYVSDNKHTANKANPAIKSPEAPTLIGQSEPMQAVQRLMEKVASSDANVLILGESGTGKEVVAKSIHRMSQRSQQAFVAVDMGTLPDNLFESELFGYRKGAFTGAMRDSDGRIVHAHQGTLFLDELGNLPLVQQGKLLTVLQNREVTAVGALEAKAVDIRLICATNENLQQQVLDGKFRQDLFYRINTVEIHLPPLRERGEDIDLLLDYYCQQYAAHYGRGELSITASDRKWLRTYNWPGNVRELAHSVERAVVLADSDTLDFSQLARGSSAAMQEAAMPGTTTQGTAIQDASMHNNGAGEDEFLLEYVERKTIQQALQFYRGNVSHAAKALGLTRGAMYRRMEKYGL